MSTVPSAPDPRSAVLSGLRALADAGLLRPLDWALAQFIAERDPEAAPELLVAALLAH
jgi:exodeoxyribonuclease V alpha subunit